MDELILHEYPLSPFCEKVRRVLAYKRLAWRRVEQPMILPRPKLLPLTGGYRRAPVLQIGADVYCDTSLIVRILERIRPEPPVSPPELEGVATIVADWADHRAFFWAVLPVFVHLLPTLPPEFIADRAALAPMLAPEVVAAAAPHAISQLRVALDRIDAAVREKPFLLGPRLTIADVSCFHPVWFLKHGPALFAEVEQRPNLARWFTRIEAIPDPEIRAMDADEVLDVARRSTPSCDLGVRPSEVSRHPGDPVTMAADDYGTEAVSGTLVHAGPDEIAIRRHAPEVGEVVLHFPRCGYRMMTSGDGTSELPAVPAKGCSR